MKGNILLEASLTNKTVRDKLKNAGWNPVEDDDPKALYDLILKVIPSTSEEALSSLYAEFTTIDRAKYESLTAFQTRVTYLKSRLESLNCLPPEKGNVITIINALKSTYPEWCNFLTYDFEKQQLSWKKLMEEMSKRANHELGQMGLAAIRHSHFERRDHDHSPQRNDSKRRNNSERKHCDSCDFKHPAYYKWCDQCKQHEGEFWTWCLVCERHYGKDFQGCKSKAETKEPKPNASARALNTTTGLLYETTTIRLSQMALNAKKKVDQNSVLLDTACFNHIFNDKRWFIKYEAINPLTTQTSNGRTGILRGKGTIRIPLRLPNGSTNVLELPNAFYMLETPCNLISAGQLEKNAVV